jgi:hypothetical protein
MPLRLVDGGAGAATRVRGAAIAGAGAGAEHLASPATLVALASPGAAVAGVAAASPTRSFLALAMGRVASCVT